MTQPEVLLAPYIVLAFALMLVRVGIPIPLAELIRMVEAHSREASLLIALGMILGFLTSLLRAG